MMPNIERGGRMTGLLTYLIGPGRANEHENPHVVAGDDTVLATRTEGDELTLDDAAAMAATLDQPRKMYRRDVTLPVRQYDPQQGKKIKVGERPGHVWHCSLAVRAETDGALTDAAWKTIAEQFVEQMGFIDPDGAKSSRWVAIRHGLSKNGNDHIHLAVQMVTEDGSRARVHNDFSRAQKICRQLERDHGLTITEGAAMRQTLPHEKRWERERSGRENSPFVDRKELRRRLRAALAGARTEAEFVQRAFTAGVIIRPRFAPGGTSQVTGYSAALPPPSGSERDPIFYSPAKHLDKNLSLPKIRAALSLPSTGDPKAVGVWQEHHVSTRTRPEPDRLGPPPAALCHRLAAGHVDANDLARIYAAVSIQFEPGKPGPLAEASEQLASVAANPMPAGYAARLMQRAVSKNPAEGWRGLMQQTIRLSRVMARNRFGGGRIQLAETHHHVTTQALATHQAETRSSVSPTPGRSSGRGPTLSARERVFGAGTHRPSEDMNNSGPAGSYRDPSQTRDDGKQR